MARILVLVEHRRGTIREGTFECVTLARTIAGSSGNEPAAVLLGSGVAPFAETLSSYLRETIVVDDPSLEPFRFEAYAPVLREIVAKEKPVLVLAPHSAAGMELVPRLAFETGRPCATDCVEVSLHEREVVVRRSAYGGKLDATLALAPGSLVTLRGGSYPAAATGAKGTVRAFPCPPPPPAWTTEHRGYRETASGAVDITQAPLILAIGRGIKDEDNVPKAQALADKLGAVLACSRPVVDKKWLGKERQVGTSGKTVKPKVYLAFGISGAFQHVAGIKGPGVFIAVNRDPKAPVFRAADYGVVDDLFKIMDALEEKLSAR
jgi:electron transfer flavoprotein alpha subunit